MAMADTKPRLEATIAFALAAVSVHAAEIDATAMVAAHNQWRAEAGVAEKLGYSPTLAASAQAWADELKQHHHCQLRHGQANGEYGENLYWASALQWSDGRKALQAVTAQNVVASWGSEKAHYDHADNRCAPGKACGHYTQVVWRASREVGCGMAVCQDTLAQVWVCRYQPAGNWVGEKPY